jgi:hypothetical protein
MNKRTDWLPANRTELYLLAELYAVPCVLANLTRSGMGEGSLTGSKTYNNFPLFFTAIIVIANRHCEERSDEAIRKYAPQDCVTLRLRNTDKRQNTIQRMALQPAARRVNINVLLILILKLSE